MITSTSSQFLLSLTESKGHDRLFKLAMQLMGFFRILKPFIDMKSETHTRQIFVSRNISNVKSRGNRENRVTYKR